MPLSLNGSIIPEDGIRPAIKKKKDCIIIQWRYGLIPLQLIFVNTSICCKMFKNFQRIVYNRRMLLHINHVWEAFQFSSTVETS